MDLGRWRRRWQSLLPCSKFQHPGDWTYEKVTISDQGTGQTVSGIAQADIDGDGYAEVFVSIHNPNQVEVYTFRP